ncbi:unnamed protein product [Caenorhabditis nigoni]
MSKIHRSIKKAANDNQSQIILPKLIDNERNGCKKCAKRKTVCIADKLRKKYSEDRENATDTDGFLRAAPPVVAIQPTIPTPGSQAVPLAARNQNNIPVVAVPPVTPAQQVGVPATPSAPLPVPPVPPHGNPPSPAQNIIVAPALFQQDTPILIPAAPALPQPAAAQIPAPVQPAAGNQLPPQAPQAAAQPEIDNDRPMYEPPFENDYYGHNGADPENEDIWAGVHIYGPGFYRLIDPKNPYLTKEQAQAAQLVWDNVQAHMKAEAPQGNEDLLN